jgi:hypothetical protein
VKRFFRWLIMAAKSKPGDWMAQATQYVNQARGKLVPIGEGYSPDKEFEQLSSSYVKNPVIAFNEDLMEGKVEIAEAWLWEGLLDARGKLIGSKKSKSLAESKIPYRTRYIGSNAAYKEALRNAAKHFKQLPAKIAKMNEARSKYQEGINRMKEAKLLEANFTDDNVLGNYDPNQYTEYAPTYGGPFNKQLYLADYLRMHALAFEAKNHNPLAKRIVDVLAQYSFGRRFKVRIKNKRQKKAWDDFEKANNITHRCSEFWIREYLTYGELMINKDNWQSIDPSTVWDIITDPDDITNVYYYYQSYPTAFQTFTGYRVAGEPGSEKQPGMKYIVRQLPADQVIHIKGNVVSQEKRGRSILFPVLGWLKRVKDLYSAEVQRAQLQATFLWDDTISGSDADVQAYAAKFASMPLQMSVYIHNEQVKRQAMPALQGGDRGSVGVGDEILAFIATAIGIPKDFFNIIAQGGSNRATALVGAEPFEKVVEDLQAKFENLLMAIAEEVMEDADLEYEKGDIEFIFPSVTKDTTTETLKNIATMEEMEYIAHETSAEMAAAEMNITSYDYEGEQQKIADRNEEKMNNDPLDPANGSTPLALPDGTIPTDPAIKNGANGAGGAAPKPGVVSRKDNPNHGTPKTTLKKQLKTL